MKTKKLITIGLLVLVLADARSTATAQQTLPTRKAVKVYLYHDPGEYIDLSPVKRLVSANAPARAAIDALLKGPTARERRQGFVSLVEASDFRIGSLSIKDGMARINFVSRRTWHGWPGDLGATRFKKAVELTLKQFPTVADVIVSLDGNTRFDDDG
jgi:spore germination protein GerM